MPHPQLDVARIGADDVDEVLTGEAASLLQRLVVAGAALGWVEPPPRQEVAGLLAELAADVPRGDACLVTARAGDVLAGLGYWRRHVRPTHRPHADVQRVAVSSVHQGRGVGRRLMAELVAGAVDRRVEVLTLDVRGDNAPARALYESLGFRRYGRLERFVGVGAARYDMLLYALDLRTGQRVTGASAPP